MKYCGSARRIVAARFAVKRFLLFSMMRSHLLAVSNLCDTGHRNDNEGLQCGYQSGIACRDGNFV